jgi:hypothetical protein
MTPRYSLSESRSDPHIEGLLPSVRVFKPLPRCCQTRALVRRISTVFDRMDAGSVSRTIESWNCHDDDGVINMQVLKGRDCLCWQTRSTIRRERIHIYSPFAGFAEALRNAAIQLTDIEFDMVWSVRWIRPCDSAAIAVSESIGFSTFFCSFSTWMARPTGKDGMVKSQWMTFSIRLKYFR